MKTHQKPKPVIIIDFDKAIYKRNKGPLCRSKNDNTPIPKIKQKLKLLLYALKQNFRIILYSKTNLHTALEWVVKNKLDKDCLFSLTSYKKIKSSFYIKKF